MEFLTVDSVESVRKRLLADTRDWLVSTETVPFEKALGRIVAKDIFAADDTPTFKRSTVDGYALLSSDTAAADESIPVFLTLKDRVDIGQTASIPIVSGECAEIPTGGMLPKGADAVVMCEYTDEFGKDGIAIGKSTAYGENVILPGEDVKTGQLLFKQGRRISPQDIGALSATGITSLDVYTSPTLALISTGDELVSPYKNPKPGQVRDINTAALSALAYKHGFTVTESAIVADDEEILLKTVQGYMKSSDIVIVSGGSSKGKKDLTRPVFDRICHVHTHGIAMQPGKPTIFGYDNQSRTLLAGLPGHPVSAMMVFEQLLAWLLREITKCPPALPIPAKLSCNIASSPGRMTCHPCRLIQSDSGYIAEPIFGKSGLITTLSLADGYIITHRDTEGLTESQIVMVHLLRGI